MAPNPRYSNSVFSGGGKEEIAAPDIYKDTIPAEGTLSKFKSISNESVDKIGNMFKASRFNATDLTDMIDLKGGIGLNKDAALRKLEGVSSYRFDSLSGFAESIKGDAIDMLGSFAGEENAGMFDSVMDSAGKLYPLLSGDADSARDLFGIIGDVLGGEWVNKFPDFAAQVGFFGSLIEKAIELGIPDAIDDLFSKIEDEEMRKEMLISNAERVARAGDLDTLYEIKGLIGAENLHARVPELYKLCLQGYRIRDPRANPSLQEIYDKMVNLFNEVDPGWDRTTRNGQVIGRLHCFATASESTKKVMSSVGNHKDMIMIGPSYPPSTLKSLAKRDFKRALV